MPTNRRNSSVVCNGIAATRLEDWRRTFRQDKRTSMFEINVLTQQLRPSADDSNRTNSQPDMLFPVSGPECLYNYSNQIVKIGSSYEFEDSNKSNLGHGAYGDVFRGKAYDLDRQHYRSVAIKRMIEMNVKSNELEAMKRVQNPFLVSLVDICHDNNHLNTYIIMELCDVDLDNYLRSHTPNGWLNKAEYNLIMQHLAFGYYALFKENIIHRDIKPQNVLLVLSPTENNIQVAKITDFGVCRVLKDANGKLSNVAGTFSFMAPEIGANILKTCEYTCTVDIWSIGCVLYQCLIGHLPFDEQQLCKLFLHCACSNFYEMTLELPENTSEDNAELIKGLLEIDYNKRTTPEQFYMMALKRKQRAISQTTLANTFKSFKSDRRDGRVTRIRTTAR